MATRFVIGKGELLAYGIDAPKKKPGKSHPYTLAEAKRDVIPQIEATIAKFDGLAQDAVPDDIAVAKLTLHPAYVAKSYFPAGLLRKAELFSLGSKTVRIRPRKLATKTAPLESDTVQLFIAGTRRAFRDLPALAHSLTDQDPLSMDFREIETLESMDAADRIVSATSVSDRSVFEAALHLLPDVSAEAVRAPFMAYAASCGYQVAVEYEFIAGRLLFVPVSGDPGRLHELANFSLLRVIRPMPPLRGARPLARSTALAVSFQLPTGAPLSREPKVAILDGGLPDEHVLDGYVGKYFESDESAESIPEYLEHGLAVSSAFLFGPIAPGGTAERPYAYVDHHRVLDAKSDEEDPFELYRTLGHVEEVLLSRQYQFLNLSLGPDLPIEDTDVHAWTSVIDSILSDSETLMTVAAGNNGERDRELRLDRIQVPSDAVNAVSVGAADNSGALWQRAQYSARGPGRSPGRRKPDLLTFGGSPHEYFHVVASGKRKQLAATLGTSFAAPFALRSAVGVRAILGADVHPLTIKALLIHACERGGHPEVDVGWGRLADDINQIVTCHDGMARIVYQGSLRPGKYLRAPIPLPPYVLDGKVQITATFCFATAVDPQDSCAYTRAGLEITFRPHEDKLTASKDGKVSKYAKPETFFPSSEYRSELEQRADLGKWEPVLHASQNYYGKSLKGACFDIHYNAREGGAVAVNPELIPYALVLTVHAPRHANLYEDILANHTKLRALESQVPLPVLLR
ncbi:S8 family peptidase [Paraburkholderia sp. Tr-20389]|uniref:S8 family peptidase n=1 Tax=Paraburkholderia sp. Tr-20389 TaxID=2703903 RepID=UPI001981CA2E|nr:S8 family peptidase [Paraburkholderia sp. Tr-20389]MBN3758188.1 S8 family peptidase [Paraburkholderia sp. Tr-20389]